MDPYKVKCAVLSSHDGGLEYDHQDKNLFSLCPSVDWTIDFTVSRQAIKLNKLSFVFEVSRRNKAKEDSMD